MTAEALRPLVAEIRTSIGYYRALHDSAPIERISLTGGGAALHGIATALTNQIGLPVRIVNPLQHVRNRHASKAIRPDEIDYLPPTAVTVGLAMGAAA